jgi:hypothetical protein
MIGNINRRSSLRATSVTVPTALSFSHVIGANERLGTDASGVGLRKWDGMLAAPSGPAG